MVDQQSTQNAVSSLLSGRPITGRMLALAFAAVIGYTAYVSVLPLGGDLTGSLPSPTIAPRAVTGAKMAQGTITPDLLAPGTAAAPGAPVTPAQLLPYTVNVRAYGAVCDGTTDNAPAFARAFAAAHVVRYDNEGCASYYLVNTTVQVPAGAALIGPDDGRTQSLGIRTSAAVDTFDVAGQQWQFEDVRIQHDGASGSAINSGTHGFGMLDHSAILGTVASNTSPLAYVAGSLVTAEDNTFTNLRTGGNAFALQLDSPSSAAPIVFRAARNNFGGTGPGMAVTATGGQARPEGVYLAHNHCFASNVCLQVNAVNWLESSGNSYDVGSGNQVVIAAGPLGVDMLRSDGDYLSTVNAKVGGVCMQVSGPVTRLEVRSRFAYCGYGVASTDGNLTHFSIGSQFVNMGNVALNLQNVAFGLLEGSNCTNCATNFIISDKGPVTMGPNLWDPAGGAALTENTAADFTFSPGNTGARLTSSVEKPAFFGAAAGQQCATMAIPHGLVGVPNPTKEVLSLGNIAPANGVTSPTVALTALDATNVTVQVCATVPSGTGAVNVVAQSSM